MCLILFRFDPSNRYPLVVAANRDEAYARPTQTAHYWPDQPHIYAGRDLQAQGSWLGVNQQGQFAALTNFRDGQQTTHSGPSRGELVTEFLRQQQGGLDFLTKIRAKADQYQGFNLLIGDQHQLWHLSNRSHDLAITELKPGYYGLSNHLLDSPWPKSEQGKLKLQHALNRPQQDWPFALQQLLLDEQSYPDTELPETGVSQEIERLLSPIFIRSEHYGTRSSSIVVMDRDRQELLFQELNYPLGDKTKQKSHQALIAINN